MKNICSPIQFFNHTMYRISFLVVALLTCLLLGVHLPFATEAIAKDTFVISRVSGNPKKHINQFQPIADYLASKMGHLGITKGQVRFARNNRDAINLLKQKKIDMITETPFSAVLFEQQAGAKPLLLRWKKGVRQYHSIIFSKQSSDIKTVEDLKGKIIAFEDRGSTSAFMLPFASLLQRGLDVVELATPRDEVPTGKVGYVFANQEINISNMVYRDITHAGAISNLDWEEGDRVNEKMKPEFKIILNTQNVPRSLELVRGDLDSKIQEAIVDILTRAHEDPEARTILRAYKKTSKFEAIDEQTHKDLQSIRGLTEQLNLHLNL